MIKSKENHMMEIENTIIVTALAPPGGGRNHVTSRLIRHFNVLSIESFDDDLMKSIFLPIINWHFTKSGFGSEYGKFCNVIIYIYFLFQLFGLFYMFVLLSVNLL